MAAGDIEQPAAQGHRLEGRPRPAVMAARGNRLVVAYSDAGKVKAKISRTSGQTFASPSIAGQHGRHQEPLARPYSVDVVGDRIVIEVGTNSKASWHGQAVSHVSDDFGADLEHAAPSATWALARRRLLKKKNRAPTFDGGLAQQRRARTRCAPSRAPVTRPAYEHRPVSPGSRRCRRSSLAAGRGLVTAPSLAELTSAAYLAMTPRLVARLPAPSSERAARRAWPRRPRGRGRAGRRRW